MLKTLSKTRPAAIMLLTIALLFSVTFSAPVAAEPAPQAKNIILMISDGWGYNLMYATDYYQYGETGHQVYQDFPVQLACSTYEYESIGVFDVDLPGGPFPYPYEEPFPSEHPDWVLLGYDPYWAWNCFDYLPWMAEGSAGTRMNNHTDSASAATAMATGVKTRDGYLGVDIWANPVPNIAEIATCLGKATGVVSSAPFSHATPAAFAVHHDNRNHYHTITDMMLYESALDVIMSTGAPDFDQDGNPVDPEDYNYLYIGPDTWADIATGSVMGADATGDGNPDEWTVIRTLAEFQDMAEGPTPTRVLGIPQVHETMQMKRTAGTGYEDPFVIPLNPDIPDLADMSKAALNVLDNNGADGFFLMIEGGAVDWACHEHWPGRAIEEQIDFNKAVEAVVAWIEENSSWDETLLIVTSDHETGYILGPDSGPGEEPGDPPTWNPIVNNGAGNMPGMEFYSFLAHPAFLPKIIGWHTNTLVPLFAKGPGADLFNDYAVNIDPVYGPYLDNTDIFRVMVEAFPDCDLMLNIDIKPNSINLRSRGVVSVMILSTDNFDATTVDPATVFLAGAAPVRYHIIRGTSTMLLQFNTQDLYLTSEHTSVSLTAMTTDGIPVRGTGTVNIVPR